MGLTRNESNSSFFDDSVHAGKKLFTHDGAWKGLPDGTVRDTRAAAPVSVNHDRTPVIGFLSPPAIYAQVVEYGAEKARMPWWKTFWLGILAGIYLSFAGAWAYAVGGRMPLVQEENPGLQELVFACFGLPFGLALIVICGAELYTTNAAYMAAAFYEGRANVTQVAKNWVCSFFGNLVGSLLMVWLVDETYLFYVPGAATFPKQLAKSKTGQKFGQEVLRGIFCNFLVCLAMWQATAAQDIIGKIVGIFFPVAAFVSISFSHVVANMYWVPAAMKLGAPISVGRYIGSSLIPDLIGNTIAAVFLLSGSYAFIYGTLSGRVFNLFCRMTGKQVHVGMPGNHTVDKRGKPQTASGIAAEDGDMTGVDDKA